MQKEIVIIGLKRAAAMKVAIVSSAMTLINVERGKAKAVVKGREEGALPGIRIRTRIRVIVGPELHLVPRTEHAVIPGPQEELRTATSGVRGVLPRNPARHPEEGLAHRKVQAFHLHLLLLLPQERSLKK